MSSLQLNLLASFSALLDCQPLENPGIKSQALLIYLAVERDRPHRRESLFTLLWPGMPEKSARHNLNQAVYALRKVFPDQKDTHGDPVPYLLTNRNTIQLNPAANVAVDVHQMDDLLESTQAHAHQDLAGCVTCFETLQRTLNLYQGDFLTDFYLEDSNQFEEWTQAIRESYRRKLIDILETLAEIALQKEDFEQALIYIDRQLALDALLERAHRQKIEALSRSGRGVEAKRHYRALEQILADELGAEPSEETKSHYQRIQASTQVKATELQPKSNLPVQTTPFIGRENELAEIQAKLKEQDCRLLTLLGPGGSGKTRLAIEVAKGLSEDYKHGTFFVNLAPLQDAEEIPSATAKALKFSFYEGGTPEQQLVDYLRNKNLLLILDNFEHILDGVAFVNQIMIAAPDVKILATSRTSLTVTGEHIYSVWGMAYPQMADLQETAANQYSAIRLFESAAKRRRDAFELSDENNPDVIQVCALVDGMPLGIILAASWIKMLTPAEIADEIAQDLAFLETELKDLPRRQRSLQSIFNHSWRLLSEHEQAILSALSVFRGGFTREAALKVAGASLRDLLGLIDKSMLQRVAEGRFEIHELLRQFAAEKLAMDPDSENQIRDKHSDFFCQALADWDCGLDGPRQGAIQQEMEIENYNIHSAWAWAAEMSRFDNLLRAFDGLCRFYSGHYRREGAEKVCRSIVERLDSLHTELHPLKNGRTDRIEAQKLKARALSWGGAFNAILGKLELALEFCEQGLALLEEDILSRQDLRYEKAICLHNLAWTNQYESRVEAKKLAEESLKLFKTVDKNWWVGITLRFLAEVASSRVEKMKYLEECLEISRKHGDLINITGALVALSYQVAWQWQFEKANQMMSEAMAIYRELPFLPGIVDTYWLSGTYSVWQGKFIEARSIMMEMLDINIDLGSLHNFAFANAIAGYPDLYLGEYKAAYDQAEGGLALCRKETNLWGVWGVPHAITILGRVAQARKNYKEAQAWFQECIPLYKTFGNQDSVGQDLACLGYIARERGQISQARGDWLDALQIAIDGEEILALIHTLPGIALLFADQGDGEKAVELYALASTLGMVANSKWFADIAGDEIAAVAVGLPVDVAEAAQARGREMDLWETAADLLVELKESGLVSDQQSG